MPKLPVLSHLEVVKALNKIGYNIDHQTCSYVIQRQDTEPYRRLTIPNHKEISKGTINSIIKQAGLTRDEFIELLYPSPLLWISILILISFIWLKYFLDLTFSLYFLLITENTVSTIFLCPYFS